MYVWAANCHCLKGLSLASAFTIPAFILPGQAKCSSIIHIQFAFCFYCALAPTTNIWVALIPLGNFDKREGVEALGAGVAGWVTGKWKWTLPRVEHLIDCFSAWASAQGWLRNWYLIKAQLRSSTCRLMSVLPKDFGGGWGHPAGDIERE